MTRFGVILSKDGGALAKMLTPFKLGLGGIIGSGRQYMSWIAIDDVDRRDSAQPESRGALTGPVNVVAPKPVTNAEFTEDTRPRAFASHALSDAGLRRQVGLRPNGRRTACSAASASSPRNA